MSLESLPVLTIAKLDPSTKTFIKKNLAGFGQLFDKWDTQNYDFFLSNLTVHRFKNQQRHFIHFGKFCHLNRRLRKASTGRSNFCIKHIIRSLESIDEIDRCVNRNCIDFLLLAISKWHEDIVIIRFLAADCWKHTERQMLTGHFVKLSTLIMCILCRVLVLSEKSISSVVELYNSLWAIRDQVPNVGLPVDYICQLPQKMTFESMITLNKACVAFLKLSSDIVSLEPFVSTHKQSYLFSEMCGIPKSQTPGVNNRKRTNHQKEKKELLSLLRNAKNKSSKSSFINMLFK